MKRTEPVFVLLLSGIFVTGCGFGQFQTAKTVPKGEVRTTVAQQFQANEDIHEREVTPNNFPPELMVRVGVGDSVDVGTRIFLGGGLLVDAKVNLIPRTERFALSLSGGFGAAADWVNISDVMAILHLPVRLLISYRIKDSFTPYAGVGYSFFWVFGRDHLDIPPPEDPNTEYVDRKGYGDGVVPFTIGIEYKFNIRFGVLLEYSFWLPAVDDPGDGFAFVPNHMGGFGFVF